jgi:hypothetical protein
MRNKVTSSNFLLWYFSEEETKKDFAQSCIDMLMSEGFVNISARMLFEDCGYIPGYICETKCDDEYGTYDVEFIQD